MPKGLQTTHERSAGEAACDHPGLAGPSCPLPAAVGSHTSAGTPVPPGAGGAARDQRQTPLYVLLSETCNTQEQF